MKVEHESFVEIVKNTPLVSIDLVVKNSDGSILLGMRNNEPAKGFWFVPGGRIQKYELIAAAFKRLTKDELGHETKIDDANFLGVFEHFYKENFADDSRFGTHYVVLAYEVCADWSIGDLPLDQHSEFRWFHRNELLNCNDVHTFVKNYFL